MTATVPISHLYITMGLAFTLVLAAMICVTVMAVKITQAKARAASNGRHSKAQQTQTPTVHASTLENSTGPAASAYPNRQHGQARRS